MSISSNTIFALSTAAGKSALAVIRISGPKSYEALATLSLKALPPPHRVATLTKLYRADGTLLDHALVCCFPAPNSFTGEDMVELHLHGSMAIIKACMGALEGVEGLTLASPGEFTQRSFLNGKFDLLEVEAIADVIDAETDAQARQAARQLDGHMGKHFNDFRSAIVEILALLEAYIDFPEEDIPEPVLGEVEQKTVFLCSKLDSLLSDNYMGERIRSGFRLAIIGAPNVGKSSLLNALAKRDAAIVSSVPGTTRDVIELHMDINGYPVILSDTAGFRETEDIVENLGISRSILTIDAADIVLALLEPENLDSSLSAIHSAISMNVNKPLLFCLTKSDLFSADESQAHELICKAFTDTLLSPPSIIRISASSGHNLKQLELRVANILDRLCPDEEPIITQQRHRNLLISANQHLKHSLTPLPLELRTEELRLAANAIGAITGKILPDELLGEIFSRFCIGK